MTSKERIQRIIKHLPVDRIGIYEDFWKETQQKWVEGGHVTSDDDMRDYFNLDIREVWCFNMVADIDFTEEIVEETKETKLVRNGNYSLLRWHKKHASTPEHVDFLVKDRKGWEEHIKPHLLNKNFYNRRINFEAYRRDIEYCRNKELFFTWSGVNVFESIHPMCGHEYMLMGMALDPDWVRDMCDTYAELIINLMEILFAREGKPDGIWFYEDMGYKLSPFMSPAMYREIIMPSHKRTFEYAHSLGLPVIVHSCGFVEPLVPGLIEAGMDCLNPMEVKAGMDLLRIKRNYGDKIALMGGMDVRKLTSNNLEEVKAELDNKLPLAKEGGGYCLHSDHSIPDQVEYNTFKYFLEYGLKLGKY